jgi:hypothetical protein
MANAKDLMRIRIVIATLSLFPLVPGLLGLAHLVIYGDLQWPMVWSNEAAAWGVILCPLAFVAILLSINSGNKSTAMLPIASLVVIALQIANFGVAPSSKGDDDELQLAGFWIEQWSDW